MYRASVIVVLLLAATVGGANAQTRIVTGKVTDSLTSEVLNSGQVSVQGSTLGTTVKDDGTFTIAVPARDVVLQIRSIGFKRKDVPVPASQNAVQVALERDYFQLEAIVVTGQATGVERKNLANSVASVTAEQLTKTPTATVEQSLQGKFAGAQITDNSGAPGGGMRVSVRGITSIVGAITPLYVVDGVIVSDAIIFSGANFITKADRPNGITGSQDNPVNRIGDFNPNDIASVEVLKGASASAIYGSKASNGVVLITTKRGKTSAPQFSVTQRFGMSHVNPNSLIGARTWQNSAEVLTQYGAASRAVSDFNAAGGQFFDNERALVGETPLSNETSVSVTGGSETTRYFASGFIRHEGGIVKGTFSDKQSIRLNLDQEVASRLHMALSSEVIHTSGDRGLTNNENNGTSWYASLISTPSFFDLRPRSDAECASSTTITCLQPGNFPVNPYAGANPLQTAALLRNYDAVWRSVVTSRFSFDALTTQRHTLRFVGVAGGDIYTQSNDVFAPPALQFAPTPGLPGTAVVSAAQNQNFNINANAVYTLKTSNGTSSTLQAGIQYETRAFNVQRIAASNLVGGIRNIRAGTTSTVEQDKQLTKDFGLFAQEELLALNEKLLLTAGMRADQSSNNGDPSKIFFYPKAAASYRLLVKPGVVDEFKVRAAFGFAGNQPKYGQKFTELRPGNVAGVAVSQLLGLTGASGITPERQREFEAGFDATLFRSRATLEATVYEKKITDLLLTRTLAPVTGYSTQYLNGGQMRTRGLELGGHVLPIQKSSVQWNVGSTFFLTRCTVMALPAGIAAFTPQSFLGGNSFGKTFIEPGKSCTQIYGRDSLGRLPGDASLGAIGSSIVRYVTDTRPDYRFSLTNDFTFKRLRLYVMLDRQGGGRVACLTCILWDRSGNSPDQLVASKPGALTATERGRAYAKTATIVYQDASFWKLREATLSYELPTSLVHRVWSGARYVRLALQGRNLLTLTPYKGTDPEVNSIVESAAFEQPWELWAYPPSRSLWFSIDLGF